MRLREAYHKAVAMDEPRTWSWFAVADLVMERDSAETAEVSRCLVETRILAAVLPDQIVALLGYDGPRGVAPDGENYITKVVRGIMQERDALQRRLDEATPAYVQLVAGESPRLSFGELPGYEPVLIVRGKRRLKVEVKQLVWGHTVLAVELGNAVTRLARAQALARAYRRAVYAPPIERDHAQAIEELGEGRCQLCGGLGLVNAIEPHRPAVPCPRCKPAPTEPKP